MNDDTLLTVNQTAIILKVHPLTVRRYIREGKISAVKVAGNIRISNSSIDSFIQDLLPTDYGIHRSKTTKFEPFGLDDPIFRLKGRGLSLKPL